MHLPADDHRAGAERQPSDIPVTQGLAYTGSPFWNVIVGPGRAWSERGDHGWTRASLPFG